MKDRQKGPTPPSKRSRSRKVATTAAQPNEVFPADSVAPSAERVSDVLITPLDAATAPTPAKPNPGVAEPVPAAGTVPAKPGAFVAVRESPAPRITTAVTPRRPHAEQIVKDHLALAVGAGMIPIPGFDLAAIGGLQLKLLASLAEHYNVPFTQAQARLIVTSLLGSVGTTWLAGAVIVSLAKIVPFFGTVVGAASMPVAGGVITRAMGHLAIDHFEAGGTMEAFNLDVAQEIFLRKIAEARGALT